MKRPYIYFYGDEKYCFEAMKGAAAYAHPVYFKEKRKSRLNRKYPVLICIIARKSDSHDFGKISKLVDYSKSYKCPILFIGSRYQFKEIIKKYPYAPIYKIAQCNLSRVIQNTIKSAVECGGDMFSLLNERYKTINLISKEAAFSALVKNKADNAPKHDYRVVITNDIFKKVKTPDVIILSENKNGVFNDSLLQKLRAKAFSSSVTLATGIDEKPYSNKKPDYINMFSDSDNLMKTIIRRTERKLNVINKE